MSERTDYTPQYAYIMVACSAPSHYLKQCWFILNWTPGNNFQWNSNRNFIIFIQEIHPKLSPAKMSAILSIGGDGLNERLGKRFLGPDSI